jgi:RNA polymerase sigma factor (TIGR02999 family)
MSESAQGDLTTLFRAACTGVAGAVDALFALVYDQLRAIAARQARIGRTETMRPTVLVNDLYLQCRSRGFAIPGDDQPVDRRLFYRTVAVALRSMLRDYRRRKRAQKRGGERTIVPLDHVDEIAAAGAEFDAVDFLVLDAAIDELEQRNRLWYETVLYRYLLGLSLQETATLMGRAPSAVKNYWSLARGWLRTRLGADDPGPVRRLDRAGT